MTTHTDTQYEAELRALTSHFHLMGARSLGMLRDSIRALFTRDPDLARWVITSDNELDKMEMEADRRCLMILARRSPVGDDLRFVTAILKAVTDLERVGDLAVNIAERSLDLGNAPGIEPGPDIEALATAATSLLNRALEAFRDRDSVAAGLLDAQDRDVDELNRVAFRRLLDVAQAHPDQMERALALSGVCRHLERVGDHAVNVAERVVFLVEGRDVRHGSH